MKSGFCYVYIKCIVLGMVVLLISSSCISMNPTSTTKSGNHAREVTLLVSLQGVARAIAVDETHIYWSIIGPLQSDGSLNTKVIDGAIMKANKDGSNVVTLASGLYPPWAIAIDATHVYWVGVDGVKKVSKTGGAVTALASWQPPDLPYTLDLKPTLDIAVDESSVYWLLCGTDSVMKMDKTGSRTVTLAAGRSCPMRLALDKENVYWIDLEDYGSVMKVSKDGKQLTELVRHKDGLTDIAVDETGVYWLSDLDFINRQKGAVTYMPFSGNIPIQLASGQNTPEHLLVDNHNLYWIEGLLLAKQSLMKMPKNGGTPQQLLSDGADATGMAIDASNIYMIIPSRHAIVSLEK